MASRDAAIRVSMRSSAFKSETRSLESHVKGVGRRMGAALKAPISAGLESAKKSIADIGSGIKNTIRTAATLGGAISIGGAAKTAMEAQTAYLQLSDALTTFSKKNWEAADAQAMVERVADKTKVPIEGLRTTLAQLASASSKVDIEPLLERASEQARRLGMQGEFVGRVYTRLVAKGVADSAEEAENLTDQFNTLFRRMLGVDLDEAIDPMDVAELAGFINTTGNEASQMLKLISLGGEEIAKDFGKANEIVEELGLSLHQTKGIDEMTKKLKLPKGAIDASKTSLENMMAIADLGPKKFKQMADALSGDVAGEALKQIIGVEFFEKNVSKKQWDLRIGEVKKQLKDLGDLAVDRARIEKADMRHRNTIQSKVNDAMNELAKAFSNEKMQKSISELAKNLPGLAEAISKVVSFIAENPITSVGLAVGGRVGGAFAGGYLRDAYSRRFSRAGDALDKVSKQGTAATGGIGSLGKKSDAAAKSIGVFQNKMIGAVTAVGTALVAAKILDSGMRETGEKIVGERESTEAFVSEMAKKRVETTSIEEKYKQFREIEGKQTGIKRAGTFGHVLDEWTDKGIDQGLSAFGDLVSRGMLEATALVTGNKEYAPSAAHGKNLRALGDAAIEHEMAIRRQMASELTEAGKISSQWNKVLFDPLKDLNTIMADFKRTMQDVKRETSKNSSRGPSKPSNANNTPGHVNRR